MPFWTHGAQLVALNYQITDRGSILNEGIFREQNGGCGYVLKPPAVLAPDIEQDGEILMLWINVLSGHFLPRPVSISNQGFINPYVIVSIDGIDQDTSHMQTDVQWRNGLNPEWDERCQFRISRRDLALLTFEVRHYLPTCCSHPFVAAAAFPVKNIRSGTRWVALWDSSRRPVENCGLLVEVLLLTQPVGHRQDSSWNSAPVEQGRCMTPVANVEQGRCMTPVTPDDAFTRGLPILNNSGMSRGRVGTNGSSVDIPETDDDIDDECETFSC
jgi:hypothetical protein